MKRIFSLFALAALCCSIATAQPPQGGQQRGQRRGGGSRPGTLGSDTLERAGIKLGQLLPDLTIFDEAGDKFRLADVKGKHTVIVFGCLT
jgi:cytochrome oxidase Cu insertion factor (SCO1/SenC/PrrC family)